MDHIRKHGQWITGLVENIMGSEWSITGLVGHNLKKYLVGGPKQRALADENETSNTLARRPMIFVPVSFYSKP